MISNKNLIEEETVDFRKWFFRILDNWLLFIVFILLALAIAFYYNKTAAHVYRLSSRVLVNDHSDPLDRVNVLNVSLYNDPYKLENEIGVLKSTGLKKRTLKQLDFFVEVFDHGYLRPIELYKDAPFTINYIPTNNQLVNCEFHLEFISDTSFTIFASNSDVPIYNYSKWQTQGTVPNFEIADTIFLGDTIQGENYCFTVSPGNIPRLSNKKFSFFFRSLNYLASAFGETDIDITSGSSIINVQLKYTNIAKAELYLNMLVRNYLQKGIERENIIAQRTIDFIDFQLTTLIDSLQLSERRLQDFRSANQIVSIDYQAEQAYQRSSELNRQKAALSMQKRYLNYLLGTLKNTQVALDELVAPSTLGIDDAVLNNLVLELMAMYNERTELTLNTKKNNPYISSLDDKIESQRVKLIENVGNILQATNISLEGVLAETNEVKSELTKLPKDQQELLRFERKFELNDELYTYLLTRRSEMQIKKASNIPKNEVLEIAEARAAVKVKPNKKITYFGGVLLGLIVPFLLVYAKTLLNHKVQSVEDLKSFTEIPVVGKIAKNEESNKKVVVQSATSVIAESFRMLRANLEFIAGDDETPVMVVSSAMKGEGKSFIAVNLAAIQASYGRKVCLVDLDLRRPRLSEYLQVVNNQGMSNYLIGQLSLNEILITDSDHPFDLITSGPIPPNPSELVASERLNALLGQLKKKYDYIILDSPPIGMVSDALFVLRKAGYLLLIARHNVTHRGLLGSLLEEIERNDIKNANLVYNDVPLNKKGYYRYGVRYGYYTKEGNRFWDKFRLG